MGNAREGYGVPLLAGETIYAAGRMTALTDALELVAHGYRVVPANANSKKPIPRGWTRGNVARTEDEVRALFAQYPNANAVAIVTGNNVAALDIDPRNGGKRRRYSWNSATRGCARSR